MSRLDPAARERGPPCGDDWRRRGMYATDQSPRGSDRARHRWQRTGRGASRVPARGMRSPNGGRRSRGAVFRGCLRCPAWTRPRGSAALHAGMTGAGAGHTPRTISPRIGPRAPPQATHWPWRVQGPRPRDAIPEWRAPLVRRRVPRVLAMSRLDPAARERGPPCGDDWRRRGTYATDQSPRGSDRAPPLATHWWWRVQGPRPRDAIPEWRAPLPRRRVPRVLAMSRLDPAARERGPPCGDDWRRRGTYATDQSPRDRTARATARVGGAWRHVPGGACDSRSAQRWHCGQ